MQNAIKKIILEMIRVNSNVSVLNIQKFISAPASVIEEYITELIVLGYVEYNSVEETLFLTDSGFQEINDIRRLSLDIKNDELAPFVGTYNKDGFPVINSLTELFNCLNCDSRYFTAYHLFNLCKKNKTRTIAAPSLDLKRKQRWILDNIISHYCLNEAVHGFVPGKSIKTNALCHINKEQIACLDLKDFFISINKEMVEQVYLSMGYEKAVARFLTKLSIYNGVLPQGAPTSPTLANIVFSQTDSEICSYACINNLTYTRYADDITLSGDCDLTTHINAISNIIIKNGFTINDNKTHLMGVNYPKKVTGLVVTNQVKVPLKYKKKLRQEIYYCKRLGVTNHVKNSSTYFDKNGSKEIVSVNFKEYLYGKAYYIRMIEYDVGERFLKQLDEIFCGI